MAIQALLVILAVLLVLLFLGVPISYAIAVSSLTAILSSIDLNVAVLTAAQRTFVGMSKFSLTAIPFFILAGNIMNQGGIAKRLVDFVMAILGKLPGALLVTNIGTNALFGAISGSASAAAAAVGSMIRDGADEQGYDPAVTAATNAASSCSGLLIPPSNALITYSLASGGTSVAALFMAGYIPGIIWALCCCVVGVLLAIKLGYKGTPGKFDWKKSGKYAPIAEPNPSYHGVSFVDAVGPAAFVTYIRAILLRDTGATISPFNAFLLLQGTETLSLRLDRHIENTKKVVEFLANHPKVEKVNHPSLPDHPDHALYTKYFKNGGASIFTFNIKGGQEEAHKFIDSLQIFSLLANVADVKSLVIHPATTTHSQLTDEELADQGIGRNTIRLSIGTEHIDDIIDDLEEAFAAVR